MRHPKSALAARRPSARQRGAALLIFLILFVTAALTYVVSSLTPEAVEARRAQQTSASLAQAREALLGYALTYRDKNAARMYGYLPMPDIGKRGTTTDENCKDANSKPLEGCQSPPSPSDIAKVEAGSDYLPTLVGRFPWRTLGMPPLRDGHGECLWLIVSSLALSGNATGTTHAFNWDTLGHLDIQTANGGSALQSLYADRPHDRPWAIIYAPGAPLDAQDRAPKTRGGAPADDDDVTECGGNYDARNYLDPYVLDAFGSARNSLANTHHASDDPNDHAYRSTSPIKLVAGGKTYKSGSDYAAGACQRSDCTLLANDDALPITGDALFETIRKSTNFRVDINSMLDRMVGCLRDKVAAGTGFTPLDIGLPAGYGRLPADGCYGDATHPLGYYSHYGELFFAAKPASGNFTVTEDGTLKTCDGVLIFAGQRSSRQSRYDATTRLEVRNYLEDPNLSSFLGAGTNFSGASQLARVVAGSHEKDQDIVRCIPSGGTFTTVESPTLTSLGVGQLVAYDAATRTLTLGKENVVTGVIGSANAAALFGCAWTDSHSLGTGLRTYFSFRFKKLGTSVGANGFIFTLADAETSSLASCGAAGTHLGYSGDNGVTPKVAWPKIGIEFDQGRNTGFPGSGGETSTSAGRNDPCGTTAAGCAGLGYNSHAAIVYWGNAAANAADLVTAPDYDDNVHGFPATPPALRPPPTNPPYPSTGFAFKDLRGKTAEGGDSYLYHVRVEITPTRNVVAAAENSNTVMLTQVWLQADSPTVANQIAAMQNTTRPMSQLYPTYAPDLQDTATLYDVAGASCASDPCPTGETCGTDNICYRQALRTLRPGFTGSQRTTDQEVHISDFFTTWVP